MINGTIALVAHDNKKIDLAEWGIFNKGTLKNYNLVCTEWTAKVIQNITSLTVQIWGYGPDRGDVVVANAILEGRINDFFFFIDLHTPHGHEHDVQTLIRMRVLKDIPLALNRTTADFIISSSII
jgi:methylglyoxal synthase